MKFEAMRNRAQEVRMKIRSGNLKEQTSGMAPGIVQGNVVILPMAWAGDFLEYCNANQKPCPVIAVSKPGDPLLLELGQGIDIRTDVPMYRVFRDGRAVDDVPNIRHLWQKDFVSFVLGCSFSFEEALLQAGIPLRHIERGTDVAVFRTNIATKCIGSFGGPLVVSMRPFYPREAIEAIQITSRFPNVHGAPIHLGNPEQIGIRDIMKPDWGDIVPIGEDEIPVFWACGVTPQVAVEKARLPICITHKPSHMLITDQLNIDLAVS